jgi:hypothetical protein
MTLDQRVRKRFWNDLRTRFWQKGAPTLDLEKNWGAAFLHEYTKLDGRKLAQCTFEYLVGALR